MKYVDVSWEIGTHQRIRRFRVFPSEELMQDCKVAFGMGLDGQQAFADVIAQKIVEVARDKGVDWRAKAEKIVALNNSRPRDPTLEEIEEALSEKD